MTTTPQRRRPHPAAPPPARRRSPALVLGVVAAVVVAALLVALLAGSGGDGDDTSPAPGTAEQGAGLAASGAAVTVTGAALPELPEAGDDPAVGRPMPTLSGTGFDGAAVSLPAPGRPTMILFVAHWCPHCQAEVPVVQRWVDGGGLPAGVDLVTVSTAVDDRRPNYPPADWLDAEGWTAPVLADDDATTAARAAGLSAFPFFIAVSADGTVVERASGELAPAQLDAMADRLAGGAP
jgi:thiol-disulfide isomerase/thioredoxin